MIQDSDRSISPSATDRRRDRYTEIIDFIRGHGADPVADFHELYRRLVFTILVSNKDDHLKNHGFLYVGAQSWRLSPVFDVNPAPDRDPHLETAILEGGPHDRSIALALEACEFFEISDADARAMIRTMMVLTVVALLMGYPAQMSFIGLLGGQVPVLSCSLRGIVWADYRRHRVLSLGALELICYRKRMSRHIVAQPPYGRLLRIVKKSRVGDVRLYGGCRYA